MIKYHVVLCEWYFFFFLSVLWLMLPSFLLSRISCAHFQSDDQGAGHLGGLLYVEELRLLSPGWPDSTRGETGKVLMSCKRRFKFIWLVSFSQKTIRWVQQDKFSFCVFADIDQRIQWAQQLQVHLHAEHQSWRAGYQLGYSWCGHPVWLGLEPSSRPAGNG